MISFSEDMLETKGALLSFSNNICQLLITCWYAGAKSSALLRIHAGRQGWDFILIGTPFAKAQIIPLRERNFVQL